MTLPSTERPERETVLVGAEREQVRRYCEGAGSEAAEGACPVGYRRCVGSARERKAGRLSTFRNVGAEVADGACPSAGDNGLLLVCFQLLTLSSSFYDNVQYRMSPFFGADPPRPQTVGAHPRGRSLEA